MKIATIEELAYLIKQAKNENLPQPIVFLGAGASKTGGIPLANEIVIDILDKYKENPKIKNLEDDLKTYPNLMECLLPFERNKLLKGYIDEAKVNVTHIYLAQMLINGFVDYVLTVNFDNLLLRALAFFNEFPPTYDMAILKDLTTTSFVKKSVVYLHGQHHGLWLLNTSEEMAKVKEIIPPILNSIKDQRPWIFIGYSGDDPIFQHIKNLGRFDNGLYWVTYKENDPNEKVCLELLEKSNTNASLIKGYDSDSFMIKLNSELDLLQPPIIDKPFTSLKSTLNKIVDIDDEAHYKGIKKRLKIAKENVEIAISQFELGEFMILTTKFKEEFDINFYKKQLIDLILEEKFEGFDSRIYENLKNPEINELLALLYYNWGVKISNLAKLEEDNGDLYIEGNEKYKKVIELDPKDHLAMINYGTSLGSLAKLNNNDEKLYLESFKLFQEAIDINPQNYLAFLNWGNVIADFARNTLNENLFLESFEKYKRASELNSAEFHIFYCWGYALYSLANIKDGDQKDYFFLESEKILKKGIELGSDNYNLSCLYAVWGKKELALQELEIMFSKRNYSTNHVEKDEDWKNYWYDEDFKNLLNKYRV